MKVKICGMCRPEDTLDAVQAGADYIGVILAQIGRRSQRLASAAAIYAPGGSAKRVGVFANQDVDEVCALAESLTLDVLQLHGAENVEFAATVAERTGCAIWKTVWLRSPADLHVAVTTYGAYVDGLLLDTAHEGSYGGTGTVFDWTLAVNARAALPDRLTLIAAGGLNSTNVKKAIAVMHPDVVDVTSGVERVIGEKSSAAIAAFVRNAKS